MYDAACPQLRRYKTLFKMVEIPRLAAKGDIPVILLFDAGNLSRGERKKLLTPDPL